MKPINQQPEESSEALKAFTQDSALPNTVIRNINTQRIFDTELNDEDEDTTNELLRKYHID